MTRNTLQRLGLFGLGIPALVLVILFFPFARYGVLAILVVLLQAFASIEMVAICSGDSTDGANGCRKLDALPSVLASSLTGLAVYASCMLESVVPGFPSPMEMLGYASTIAFLVLIAPIGFAKKVDTPFILHAAGARALTHLYAGVLGSFLVIILSDFDSGPAPIFTFLLMTFGNDSLAWLTGVTLGKRRGIIPMSPNKSVAGFIGGFAGSIAGGFIAQALFPASNFPGPVGMILFGLAMGLAVITGDLVESGFKRSARVKDSGTIVPGRGGVLDSVDSLLFAAPVFVLLSRMMQLFPAQP